MIGREEDTGKGTSSSPTAAAAAEAASSSSSSSSTVEHQQPGQDERRMSEASHHSHDIEGGLLQEVPKGSDLPLNATEEDFLLIDKPAPGERMIGTEEEAAFFLQETMAEETRHHCLKALRNVFYVAMPLSIVASIMACIYGWIYTNSEQYMAKEDSWQRCIIYNSAGATVTPQNFTISASAFGGLMFIFMGLGFKAGYLALHDIELLPYSLSITCYTLLAQLVYRPVNPIVPAITELTPTLISLTYFINPDMYKDVPGASEAARAHAYRVNIFFLSMQYLVFAANVLNLVIQIYTAWKCRKVPREEPYVLVWYCPSLILVALAFGAYVMTIAAKEHAALETMFLLDKVGKGFLFPFQKATLDVVGLFLLLTIASVIFGVCKQQTEAFKWASFTAYIHVLLSYPIIINNFQAYHLYGFWNNEGCTHFLETDVTHSGGANRRLLFIYASIYYPDIELQFCRDNRVALVGQVLQFFIMHITCAACLLVVFANWRLERPSMQLRLFGGPGRKEGGGSGAVGSGSASLTGSASAAASSQGVGGGGSRRYSSPLQEPFLPQHVGEGGGEDGGQGQNDLIMDSNGLRQSFRSRASSIRSRTRTTTPTSLNDHLLGPVLD